MDRGEYNPDGWPAAFAAVYAEAHAAGLPEHFTHDLWHHQRHLSGPDAPERFLWHVQVWGTHVLSLDPFEDGEPGPGNHPRRLVTTIRDCFGGREGAVWHYWNGRRLRRVTYEKALDLARAVKAARPKRRS